MPIENFKRHENKYMISSLTRQIVESAISNYMLIDEFGETTITSVYFDDNMFSVISRSNEKPLYKEKLRFRAYGKDAGKVLMNLCSCNNGEYTMTPDDVIIFAELKKKFKGIVYKRRVPLVASCIDMKTGELILDAMRQAEQRNIRTYSDMEWQIGKEVQAFFNRHENMRPAVATICERTSYKPNDTAVEEKNRELRFTFDSNLRYVDMTNKNAIEIPELDSDISIMEIKCVGSYPIWLTDLLSKEKCYPQSFSKCGTAAVAIHDASVIC